MSSSPSYDRRESVGIIALITAVLLLFMLGSYDPADLVLYDLTVTTTNNLFGIAGAYAADAWLRFCGWFAYLPTVLLLYLSLLALLGKPRLTIFNLRPHSLLGFVFILMGGGGLLQLYLTTGLPNGPAGLLGKTLIHDGIARFGKYFMTLMLLIIILIGIGLAFRIPWRKFCQAIGFLLLIPFRIRHITTNSPTPTPPLQRAITVHPPQPLSPPHPEITSTVPVIKKLHITAATAAQPLDNDSGNDIEENNTPSPSPARAQPNTFTLPPLDLLTQNNDSGEDNNEQILLKVADNLEKRLKEFGIAARVIAANPGPVVTRFELDLAPGVKVAKVSNIVKDLARALAVISVRVVEVIPGKTLIGIEVPNAHRRTVRLREVIDSEMYRRNQHPLTLALGHDIEGKAVVTQLARMPHLLVAGTTGAGKSVGVNAMLLSLLYKATPEEIRLILIDPKMLELSVYKDIPHLLTEVIVDMDNAARGLKWCVLEMERRYQLLAQMGVRNLAGYNEKIHQAATPILDPTWDSQQAAPGASAPALKPLPLIVVVVDEYADMMMTVGKKAEELIARIAQKARAAGIHLILATQRPSVDIITGLIKANIPARISYQVSSRIDSRTILDQGGAEQLLGQGDMLFLPSGVSLPARVHGAFVSDEEVHRVADFWRAQGKPEYQQEILQDHDAQEEQQGAGDDIESQEPLYDQAVEFVLQTRKVSVSSVQRRFKIGYNRAARIIESMETAGLVSPMERNGKREVLVPQSL